MKRTLRRAALSSLLVFSSAVRALADEVAPRAASIPIELPDTSSLGEDLVGGVHGIFVALAVIVVVGVLVWVVLELTHHHVLIRCERCLHHRPSKSPPPAIRGETTTVTDRSSS